jgi:hypothetical protein
MRYIVSLMIFATISLSSAETDLMAPMRYALDTVLEAAKPGSERAHLALTMLERIAMGQSDLIEDGWEVAVGLSPGRLRERVLGKAAFGDPYARAYAFEKIGECALPEALEFLTNVAPADLAPDETGHLWPASQVGLTTAHLIRAADETQRVEILRAALKTAASAWAEEELCNRGALLALADVKQMMRQRWSGKRGEDAAAFCESRMQVIVRDPDRVKALTSVFGSFISMVGTYEGRRLLSWAIDELAIIGGPQAKASLEGFRAEIERILKTDPDAPHLADLRTQTLNAVLRVNAAVKVGAK